jgi:hypothetical protein
VTAQPVRGPIVIDTDVFGADLVPESRLAELYEPVIVGRPAFISFQTAAELRFGALLRGWGTAACSSSKPSSRWPRLFIADQTLFSSTPSYASTVEESGMP